MIYLDNAATTRMHEGVLHAMMPYLTDEYGNAGSLHCMGRVAKDAVNKARRQVAEFAGCEPYQVIFTSGGTEANNLLFSGIERYLREIGRTKVVTTNVEHDSVLKSARELCGKEGFELSIVGVDSECSCDTKIEHLLTPSTAHKVGLVSAMCVNNETGCMNDIGFLADVAHECGALFHSDCVQAASQQLFNFYEQNLDFITISSHKIHGPKGIGALIAKNPELLTPLIQGGATQEWGLRGGTENVAAIVGFGKACELASESPLDPQGYYDATCAFLDELSDELERVGFGGVMHNNCPTSIGKVINIRFDRVDAETLVLMLDSVGVCVSAGSACRSLESEPSHVLRAIGLTDEQARSSIRISISELTTMEELSEAARKIAKCVSTILLKNPR